MPNIGVRLAGGVFRRAGSRRDIRYAGANAADITLNFCAESKVSQRRATGSICSGLYDHPFKPASAWGRLVATSETGEVLVETAGYGVACLGVGKTAIAGWGLIREI